ncbi:MAG: cytochrome P450, partial [Micrococcales bacterium]|nr:cytochrome P450 [Micrococcales bacterium]
LMLGNALWLMLSHRDQWEKLRKRPELLDSAVEECLRYESPSQIVSKSAKPGLVLGGVAIPAGDPVFMAVGAANRDPRKFPEADRFDIERVDNKHLTFSSGNGNLISVSDADANGSVEQVTLTVTHGSITLSGTTGLSFLVGSGTGDATMTLQGTLTDINNALAGMVYTPTAGYNGADSLQITTNDLGNTGSGGAQSAASTIALTVNPINPRVTDVSSTSADGGYKVGDTIYETVTFDQTVTVDTTGGAPTLLLATGTVDRNAVYVSGSGSNTLTFAYTVQAGDNSSDLDYVSTASLALNGSTIRNGSGDSAILSLPTPGSAQSIAGQKAIVVDGIAPTVT